MAKHQANICIRHLWSESFCDEQLISANITIRASREGYFQYWFYQEHQVGVISS